MSTNPQAMTTIAPPAADMAVWRVTVAHADKRLSYRVAATSRRAARRKVSTHRAQAGEPKACTLDVVYLHPVSAIELEA